VFIYCILHKNNRFIIQYFQLHTHNGERENSEVFGRYLAILDR